MTTLAQAIVAALTHPAGSGADPLTESLSEQMGLDAAPDLRLREGWENEPASPPHPWRLYLLAFLLGLLLLPGCGGGDDDEPDQRTPTPHVNCQAQPERCR